MMAGVPMPSPLPVRNGVGPTRLRVPSSGPWATIAEYVVDRFDHLNADDLYRRFDAEEIVGADGSPIDRGTTLGAHRFVWYYRDLPTEEPVPFEEEILHVAQSQYHDIRVAKSLGYATCWIERRQGQKGFGGTPAVPEITRPDYHFPTLKALADAVEPERA